jgi:2-hydroxy-3-oxopropionate reductase
MKRIGFVGLGIMGSGIASNLMAKGFELSVFARSPEKAQPFIERGAHCAGTLAELGETCEAVVLSVPNTGSVDQVLFGPDGVASRLRTTRFIIDTSTISVQGSRDFNERLAQKGVAFLDAPVSGGQKGAADGTLTCMVGGPVDAFETCQPIFQAFAKTVARIGDSGAGQICKSCNQICVIASMLGAAEMVALCIKSGIDPLVVRSVLLGGSAKSAVIENHALRLINRKFEPGFRADLLLKDLRLALDLERANEVFAPITTVAEPLFVRMLEEGMGELDWSAVGILVQQLSGLEALET